MLSATWGANLDMRLPPGLPWESTIAHAREHMENCTIVFWSLERSRYFLFRDACQNLVFVALSPLHEAAGGLPTSGEAKSWPFSQEPFDWVWKVHASDYVYSYQLPDTRGQRVLIIPHAVATVDEHIGSRAVPMRLQAFVQGIPERQASAASSRSKASSHEKDPNFCDRFPWARKWLREGPEEAGAGDGGARSVHLADSALTEESIEAISSAVEEQRRQWHAEHDQVATDFVCELTGGAWARANLGVNVDGVRASAKRWAQPFCQEVSLPMSSSFSFRVYGEARANVLAMEWAYRMQWLYNLFRHDGREAVCRDDVFLRYEATAAFEEARRAEPPTNHRFHARAEQILALRPS